LITDFSFGYANDFCGGFDDELTIEYMFDEIASFDDGLCPIQQNDEWGIINQKGDWGIRNRYQSLSNVSFGLAFSKSKNYFGIKT